MSLLLVQTQSTNLSSINPAMRFTIHIIALRILNPSSAQIQSTSLSFINPATEFTTHITVQVSSPSPGRNQSTSLIQTTSTLINRIVRNIVYLSENSVRILYFLQSDLRKIFKNLSGQSRNSWLDDIDYIRGFSSDIYDHIRFIFSCWTLQIDYETWSINKSFHQFSVRNFARNLEIQQKWDIIQQVNNIKQQERSIRYDLEIGKKIHIFIMIYKEYDIVLLLIFIQFKTTDDNEISIFAELCRKNKNIINLLKIDEKFYK